MAQEDIHRVMTLEAIVNETIYSLPENQRTLYNKRRFTNFAIKGMRYLAIRVFPNTKREVKVEPDTNNRIDFPADMEKFVALYIPINGKKWYLTRNDDMITTKTVVGNDVSLDTEDGEGVALETEQLETFTSKGGINKYGYYTLDHRNEEIIVNATSRDELTLAYISSGVSNTSTTNIPAIYAPCLTAYILWRDIQYDRSVSAQLRKEAMDALDYEIKELKKINVGNLWEWIDAWNSKSMVR